MPEWLKDAVFYEIYPQSYKDTNGDGIGDFDGITMKLDYIKDLGFNALWINPCFDSPFKDAGYDVRDYKKAAERYGTNEDLYRLFDEAHKRGIRVLLDLVPGHTSEEHEWFRKSGEAEPNEYWNRYIWSNFSFEGASAEGHPYVGGECDRSGTYLLNFFKCQPALNYGFLHPTEAWQLPVDHPDVVATREAMKDVMRFWLDHGCDGFRVDMAGSLVKNDDEVQSGTAAIWKNIRAMLDREYPEAAIIAEWSRPEVSLKAGFHMDFLLQHQGKGYSTLVRDYGNHAGRNILSDPCFRGTKGAVPEYEDHSFFKKDAGGDITAFLNEYLEHYEKTKNDGYISLITCNHDTVRPSYNMSDSELKIFYAFLFTMPGVPFLYYGDEIGMRYQNLPTKEGGYFRTGSRTPMQWSKGANLGFSEADPQMLYLPTDPGEDAPNAKEQAADPDSLLNCVKALLRLRHSEKDLQSDAEFRPRYAEAGRLPFVYQRGALLVAVNPSGRAEELPPELKAELRGRKEIFRIGEGFLEEEGAVGAQSFCVFS